MVEKTLGSNSNLEVEWEACLEDQVLVVCLGQIQK